MTRAEQLRELLALETRIRRLVQRGFTTPEIARQLDVSEVRVRRARSRIGLAASRGAPRGRPFGPHRDSRSAEAAQLVLEEGVSSAEAARRHGITRSAVSTFLRRHRAEKKKRA